MKNLLFAAALALSATTALSAPTPARAAEERIEGPIMVFFGPNASTIEGQAVPILENVKGQLQYVRDLKNPKAALVIEGYADPGGESAGAAELSQRRAKAVHDFLVGHGIPDAVMTVRALGVANPVLEATSPEKLNRRVEIFITNGEAG